MLKTSYVYENSFHPRVSVFLQKNRKVLRATYTVCTYVRFEFTYRVPKKLQYSSAIDALMPSSFNFTKPKL